MSQPPGRSARRIRGRPGLERGAVEERLRHEGDVVGVGLAKELEALVAERDPLRETGGGDPGAAELAGRPVRLEPDSLGLGPEAAELRRDRRRRRRRHRGCARRLAPSARRGPQPRQQGLDQQADQAAGLALGGERDRILEVPADDLLALAQPGEHVLDLQVIAADPGLDDAGDAGAAERLEGRRRDDGPASPATTPSASSASIRSSASSEPIPSSAAAKRGSTGARKRSRSPVSRAAARAA